MPSRAPNKSQAQKSGNATSHPDATSRTRVRWIHILIVGALTLCAWGMFAAAAIEHTANRRIAQESPSWPSVIGVVTNDGQVRYQTRKNGSAGKPFASVDYRYEVANQEFHGSRYTVNNHLIGASDFPVDRYRRGTEVEVFYDPSQPSISLLRTGAPIRDEGPKLFLIFCTGVSMVGLTIALYYRMRYQQRQKSMTRQQRRMAERRRARRLLAGRWLRM